ncbi:Hypothetical protein SCF082_LOCUS34450, partial [Durusdinium trenchii]
PPCTGCTRGVQRLLVTLKLLPAEAKLSPGCLLFVQYLRARSIKVVVFDMDLTMGGGHCGEGILKEDAGAYIAKASPDFVEALRALVALDFKLAVATNSDPAEYDLPGQSRESHILGPDLATALIKYWCREALPKFEVMVGFDPDLHDDPRLLGKSHHMRIIAEHYQVPFEEMLLIDDSARNLRNTDGWQGLLVREPKVGFRFEDCQS